MAECKKLDAAGVARFLLQNDGYALLSHSSPDGDTLGSAFALKKALNALGKSAEVLCGDKIPQKYSYLGVGGRPDYEIKTVVAIDVADTKLLGGLPEELYESVDLCIDHHLSNREYAERLFLEPDSASCAEVVYKVIKELGVEITEDVATALYTGIATDTGCFVYANATADTLIAAAELIKLGADKDYVNQTFFVKKSKGRMFLEKKVLDNLEMYFDGLCAMTVLDYDTINSPDSDYSELDGVAAIPRTVEGVAVGITVKEKERGYYKISVRSFAPIDASSICARLSGGGHARAAGCEMTAELETVKQRMLESVKTELDEQGLI